MFCVSFFIVMSCAASTLRNVCERGKGQRPPPLKVCAATFLIVGSGTCGNVLAWPPALRCLRDLPCARLHKGLGAGPVTKTHGFRVLFVCICCSTSRHTFPSEAGAGIASRGRGKEERAEARNVPDIHVAYMFMGDGKEGSTLALLVAERETMPKAVYWSLETSWCRQTTNPH